MPNEILTHEQVTQLIEDELHDIETANLEDKSRHAADVHKDGWLKNLLKQIFPTK